MNSITRRVTGKQVARDAAILIKDTGIFLFDFGRLVIVKAKELFKSDNAGKSDNAEKSTSDVSTAATGITA